MIPRNVIGLKKKQKSNLPILGFIIWYVRNDHDDGDTFGQENIFVRIKPSNILGTFALH